LGYRYAISSSSGGGCGTVGSSGLYSLAQQHVHLYSPPLLSVQGEKFDIFLQEIDECPIFSQCPEGSVVSHLVGLLRCLYDFSGSSFDFWSCNLLFKVG
jgi:hypothetical protein